MVGTYAPEEEKVVYGITTPIETCNPIKINLLEYANILKDMRQSNGLRDALGFVFKEPGWKPAKPEQSEHSEQ